MNELFPTYGRGRAILVLSTVINVLVALLFVKMGEIRASDAKAVLELQTG